MFWYFIVNLVFVLMYIADKLFDIEEAELHGPAGIMYIWFPISVVGPLIAYHEGWSWRVGSSMTGNVLFWVVVEFPMLIIVIGICIGIMMFILDIVKDKSPINYREE